MAKNLTFLIKKFQKNHKNLQKSQKSPQNPLLAKIPLQIHTKISQKITFFHFFSIFFIFFSKIIQKKTPILIKNVTKKWPNLYNFLASIGNWWMQFGNPLIYFLGRIWMLVPCFHLPKLKIKKSYWNQDFNNTKIKTLKSRGI